MGTISVLSKIDRDYLTVGRKPREFYRFTEVPITLNLETVDDGFGIGSVNNLTKFHNGIIMKNKGFSSLNYKSGNLKGFLSALMKGSASFFSYFHLNTPSGIGLLLADTYSDVNEQAYYKGFYNETVNNFNTSNVNGYRFIMDTISDAMYKPEPDYYFINKYIKLFLHPKTVGSKVKALMWDISYLNVEFETEKDIPENQLFNLRELRATFYRLKEINRKLEEPFITSF